MTVGVLPEGDLNTVNPGRTNLSGLEVQILCTSIGNVLNEGPQLSTL